MVAEEERRRGRRGRGVCEINDLAKVGVGVWVWIKVLIVVWKGRCWRCIGMGWLRRSMCMLRRR